MCIIAHDTNVSTGLLCKYRKVFNLLQCKTVWYQFFVIPVYRIEFNLLLKLTLFPSGIKSNLIIHRKDFLIIHRKDLPILVFKLLIFFSIKSFFYWKYKVE